MESRVRQYLNKTGDSFDSGPRIESGRYFDSSGDQVLDNFSMHIREPEVTACIPEGEVLMVKAEKVKHRCVQVVNMHGLFDGLVPKLVASGHRDARDRGTCRSPH